jgi:hypothetical protein
MIGPISEEKCWPKPKQFPYQHYYGLLSMKPANNIQEFHDSKMSVDLAEYQQKIATDDYQSPIQFKTYTLSNGELHMSSNIYLRIDCRIPRRVASVGIAKRCRLLLATILNREN